MQTGVIRTPVTAASSEGFMRKHAARVGQSLTLSISNHVKFGGSFVFLRHKLTLVQDGLAFRITCLSAFLDLEFQVCAIMCGRGFSFFF